MKKLLRSIIVTFIILGLFIFFINKNLPVIKETYRITSSHITMYLVLAFLVMFVSLYFATKMYLKIFRMAKLERTPREMISLLLQGLAVNIIVPTGGISMAILFADDAKERNQSPAQAVNGIFLSILTDYVAISLLLLVSLLFLFSTNSLTLPLIISASVFFLLTVLLFVMSYLASAKNKFMEKLFYFIAKFIVSPISKLLKRKTDIHTAVRTFNTELAMAFRSIREDPKDLFVSIGYSLGFHFSRLTILYLVFVSLGFDPQIREVLAGYAVGALFVVVSPTPNGIGFVEGSMGLLFASFGISAAGAATAVILYRTFTFWIPFGVGFFLLQHRRFREIREETVNFKI